MKNYLQPQNLVMMGSFPESEVKLCDFEISRVILEGTEVREILGTPDYVGESRKVNLLIFLRIILKLWAFQVILGP